MEILRLELIDQQKVEVAVIGPENGDPLVYFHSPATAGEELNAAAPAAEEFELRVISLRRPSIVANDGNDFIDITAELCKRTVEALGLEEPVLLAWSGGAPYALAAAARVGESASSVHLVSPIPGPLRGPNALPNQTDRLREVAATTSRSPWVSGPATLRDYQALASPWHFDLNSIDQHVTIWSPSEDEIVPRHLLQHLVDALPSAEIVEVPGRHDWLVDNWSVVLGRSRS